MSDDAPTFRQYRFCQGEDGKPFELSRSPEQVECLAFDLALQRFVSFHVLTIDVADRAKFRENALEVQALSSPYLAPVVHAGEDEDTPFYVTRMIDGPTLEGYLGNLGSIEPYLVGILVRQIGELLDGMEDWKELLPNLEPRDFRVVEVENGCVRVILTSFSLAIEQQRASETDLTAAVEGAETALMEALSRGGSETSRMQGGVLRQHLAALLAGDRSVAMPVLKRLRGASISAIGGSGERPVARAYRPGRLLIRDVSSTASLQRAFGQQFELAPSPGMKSLSYAYQARDQELGSKRVLQLFPADSILPSSAIVSDPVGETAGEAFHLRVTDNWNVDEHTILSEPAVDGFDLETYLARRPPLQPRELLNVLNDVHSALEARSGSRTVPARLLPRDIFIEFDREITAAEREKYEQQPLGGLPSHSFKVRLHSSMDAFTDGWSYCPKIDPATAGASTSEQTKMRSEWIAELFVCLTCRLLGLGQVPSERQVENAGFPEPLERLLLQVLPGRFRAGGQLPVSKFLKAYTDAVRPSDTRARDDLLAADIRPLGHEAPPSLPAQSPPHLPVGSDSAGESGSGTSVAEALINPVAVGGTSKSDVGFAQALFNQDGAPGQAAPSFDDSISSGDDRDLAEEILAAQRRRATGRWIFIALVLAILAVLAYAFLRGKGLLPEALGGKPKVEQTSSSDPKAVPQVLPPDEPEPVGSSALGPDSGVPTIEAEEPVMRSADRYKPAPAPLIGDDF